MLYHIGLAIRRFLNRVIISLYRLLVDELYLPERAEWNFRAGGGVIRISSNTNPSQEKYIVGKVTTYVREIQGERHVSAEVKVFL